MSSLRLLLALTLCLVACAVADAKKTPPTPTPTPHPGTVPALPLVAHPPAYYFTASYDPRYQIIGVGQMTETQAKTANHYRFTFNADGSMARVEYFRTAKIPAIDSYFTAARIEIARSIDPATHSRTETRSFFDTAGKPVEDDAAELLSVNATGGVESITCLNDHGTPANDSNGVCRYARKMDGKGQVIDLTRYSVDSQGQFTQTMDSDGQYETKDAYDDEGRIVERANFDAVGNLHNNHDGIAITRTVYNLFPDYTLYQESYFGSDHVAVTDKQGIHMKRLQHDKRDFIVKETYFDTRGAPCEDTEDRNSQEAPLASFDYLHIFKDLPDTKDHIHGKRRTYDDNGNLIDIVYLGLDDDPKDAKPKELKSTGYAEIKRTYDDQNRVISEEYLGDDGSPVLSRLLDVAFVQQEYDASGNIVACQYFDAQHAPINHQLYGVPAIRIVRKDGLIFILLRNAQDQPAANEPDGGYYSLSYNPRISNVAVGSNNHSTFYDKDGVRMTRLQLYIKRFLYSFKQHTLHDDQAFIHVQLTAELGAAAVALGALLAFWMSVRKASAAATGHPFVPRPIPRLLALIAFYLMGEGLIRFIYAVYFYSLQKYNITVNLDNIHILEVVFLIYFALRVWRNVNSIRVYNVSRDDLTLLIKDFFASENLSVTASDKPYAFASSCLELRLRYFPTKKHATARLKTTAPEGRELRMRLVAHLRKGVKKLVGPSHSIFLLMYYPLQAICYFVVCFIGLGALWLLVQN